VDKKSLSSFRGVLGDDADGLVDHVRGALHDRLVADPAPESALDQLPDAAYLDFDLDQVADATRVREPHGLGHENGTVTGQPGADRAGHETREVDAVHQRTVASVVHGIDVAGQPGECFHVRFLDASRDHRAVTDRDRFARRQRPSAQPQRSDHGVRYRVL